MREIKKKRPSCKAYSPCKSYSLWKMVSLGQKLKMSKTCEKPFQGNIRVVLCKKPARKNKNIQEIRDILQKLAILSKPIAQAKAIAFAKWSVWVQKLKISKTSKKPFYMIIRNVLCKKTARKNKTNIREMSQNFAKSAIMQGLQPMQRLQPLQNGQFGLKIKNGQFGLKIKNFKNMRKTILQKHYNCSVQKNHSKKHQILEK